MRKLILSTLLILSASVAFAQNKADKTNGGGKYSELLGSYELKGEEFKDLKKEFKGKDNLGFQKARTVGTTEIPEGYWVFVKEGMPDVVSTTENGATVSVGVTDVFQAGKAMVKAPVIYVWKNESIPMPSNNSGTVSSNTGNQNQSSTVSTINFSTPANGSFGLLTDPRDGKVYRTVKIGTQWWMAQNLNHEISNSYCYDKKSENCDTYGRLYSQKDAKTECPSGWHLPTAKEFNVLSKYVGDNNFSLKETGTSHWAGTNAIATNETGFTALPGGYLYGSYANIAKAANFWTAEGLYYVHMKSENSIMNFETERNYGQSAFSVRCVQDEGAEYTSNHTAATKTEWQIGNGAMSVASGVSNDNQKFKYEIYKDGSWVPMDAKPENIKARIVLTSSTGAMWRDLAIDVKFPEAGGWSVNLRIEKTETTPTTHTLKLNSDSNVGGFVIDNNGKFKTFMTESGTMTVTSIDKDKRLVSGKFEASNARGEKVKGEFSNIKIAL